MLAVQDSILMNLAHSPRRIFAMLHNLGLIVVRSAFRRSDGEHNHVKAGDVHYTRRVYRMYWYPERPVAVVNATMGFHKGMPPPGSSLYVRNAYMLISQSTYRKYSVHRVRCAR